MKSEVVALLRNWKLDPIVLHEQPNEGLTVIEKFERYAGSVGFAVVLLTADDKGGLKGKSDKSYKPRARQNVILELGYFFAKLGRSKVCTLYAPGVEIPSDIHGILYCKIDKEENWKKELARELDAADYSVDPGID